MSFSSDLQSCLSVLLNLNSKEKPQQQSNQTQMTTLSTKLPQNKQNPPKPQSLRSKS